MAMAPSKTQQQLLDNFLFFWLREVVSHLTREDFCAAAAFAASDFAYFGAWLVRKSCMKDITMYSLRKVMLKV